MERRSKTRVKGSRFGWESALFTLPAVLVVFFVIAFPLGQAIWLSFTDKSVGNPTVNFIGMQNYNYWLHSPLFWQALRNSLVLGAVTVAISLLLGMPCAIALERFARFKNIIAGIALIPWISPTVVSSLVWYWMLNPFSGLINWTLSHIGLIDAPVNWLGTPGLAMFSIILVSTWRRAPYFGVVLNAGLSEVPVELYEAARIDGANAWQQFRFVTLPALRGLIFLVSILGFIETAYSFTFVYVLTRGGPAGTTQIIPVQAFVTAFNSGQLGKGIAMPLLTIPLFIPLMVIGTRRLIARWTVGGTS